MGRTHSRFARGWTRGAFRLSWEVGANGSSVCNGDHDNDRRRARNGEADAVDVAGSINPQSDPGLVGMQVQLCVNLQWRAMRWPNPPLTTPVSCIVSIPIIVRILTAGTDDKNCRIAIARSDNTCEALPLLFCAMPTCVCRAVCLTHAHTSSQQQMGASAYSRAPWRMACHLVSRVQASL